MEHLYVFKLFSSYKLHFSKKTKTTFDWFWQQPQLSIHVGMGPWQSLRCWTFVNPGSAQNI